MDNEILVEKLKVILATAHAFALKAQNYHWNVTGPHFLEYHKFFGKIYEKVGGDTDNYAEFIRQLGMFAPGSLSRFSELSRVKDEQTIPAASVMISRLSADNMTMINLIKGLHADATEAKNFSLTSFLEEKLQYHEKLGWFFTALLAS